MKTLSPHPRSIALSLALLLSLGTAVWAAAKAAPVKGYRSLALTLDSDQATFTKEGDYVDVMVTFDALLKDNKKEKVTETILQNVKVIAVRSSISQKGKSVLLLMLNPNESQYLALSIDGGYELRIVNRKHGDAEMKPMEMASFRKLFR